jgi:hypothetical protein
MPIFLYLIVSRMPGDFHLRHAAEHHAAEHQHRSKLLRV